MHLLLILLRGIQVEIFSSSNKRVEDDRGNAIDDEHAMARMVLAVLYMCKLLLYWEHFVTILGITLSFIILGLTSQRKQFAPYLSRLYQDRLLEIQYSHQFGVQCKIIA